MRENPDINTQPDVKTGEVVEMSAGQTWMIHPAIAPSVL
jgi:hypothetical protein